MKTPEDEAFDDLARRQGMWGGGFPAKRAMAADKVQDGKCKYCVDGCIACDARAQPAQEPYDQTALELCEVCGWKTLIPDDGCLNCERTQPAQEQEEDWGALAEKQLASIKRDTRASFEDAMVRATHKVMAEFEAQPAQEPVACIVKGYLYMAHEFMSEIPEGATLLYTTPPLPVQPVQEPDALTIVYQSGYHDGKKAALAGREWNFCERCGKRTADLTVIHTCTPPQDGA